MHGYWLERHHHETIRTLIRNCDSLYVHMWRMNSQITQVTYVPVGELKLGYDESVKACTNLVEVQKPKIVAGLLQRSVCCRQEVIMIEKINAIEKAKADLKSAIKKTNNVTMSNIRIDPKRHEHFLRFKDEIMQQIVQKHAKVRIRFSANGTDNTRIDIEGPIEPVRVAKQQLQKFVQDFESMVTCECTFPRKYRAMVRGLNDKCTKLKTINVKFNVWTLYRNGLPSEDEQPDEPVDCERLDTMKTGRVHDVIQIFGQPNDAEAARQAILNLLPITIKVDVPNYLHPFIIGPGGSGVKDFVRKHHVHLQLSRVYPKLDYIMITGLQSHVETAKQAVLELSEKLAQEYFTLKIPLDAKYHLKIAESSATNQIMYDNDVVISFPCIGDSAPNVITIMGQEKNVRNAQEAVRAIINKLDQTSNVKLKPVPELHKSNVPDTCGQSIPSVYDIGSAAQQETYYFSDVYEDTNKQKDDITIRDSTNFIENFSPRVQHQRIYEKINLSWNALSSTSNDADKFEEIRKDLKQLYGNIISDQENKIKVLQVELNNQVSIFEKLKVQRVALMVEINDELEKHERAIHENGQKYHRDTAVMIETIRQMEEILNQERKERSKLIAVSIQENEQSSRGFIKALQSTMAEKEHQIKHLEFKIKELQAEETHLNSELNRIINDNAVMDEKTSQVEKMLADREKEISKLKAENNERSKASKALQSENEVFQATLTENEKQIRHLESGIKELQVNEVNLNAELNRINKDNAVMHETIGQMDDILTAERKERSKLIAENYKSSKGFTALQSKHRALQVTLMDYEKEIKSLKSSNNDLKNNGASLKNELKQLNHSLNENLNREREEKAISVAKIEELATISEEMALANTKLNTLQESRFNTAKSELDEANSMISKYYIAQCKHMEEIDLLENALRVSNNEAIEVGSAGIRRDYENWLKIRELERISTVQDFILASFAIVSLCSSQLSFGYRIGISMILLIIRMFH